jgi:hypothetical protein
VLEKAKDDEEGSPFVKKVVLREREREKDREKNYSRWKANQID